MNNSFWIDLDNSPHVPLFKPIIKEFDKRGIKYFITSRKFAQTEELLKLWGIPHQMIGEHAGKNKIKKIVNLVQRSSQLKKNFKYRENLIAVSHGSRTQVLAAWRMGISSILMLDYEYTEVKLFNYFAKKLLIPKFIPDERLSSAGINLKKVIRYNGFKEELYLKDFKADPDFRNSINISPEQILVVVRPPSMTGNYHDPRSEKLLIEAINYFSNSPNTIVLIVNRTENEGKFILRKIVNRPNVRFLQKAVDGLQLLFAADISVSGGGTMNREAALLGTKAYSIFTGRRPYLDEYLQSTGRLKFIEKAEDLNNIAICRNKKTAPVFQNNLVSEIADIIIGK